jgi:hypothetical protein
MGLVNPDWLRVSDVAGELVDNDFYDVISDYVDAEIRKDFEGVTISGTDTIPVDTDGYVTGSFLRSYCTDLALYRMFLSKAGVRDGQPDVLRDMAYIHEREYREQREKLTRTKVMS